jgi:hypothetical protein
MSITLVAIIRCRGGIAGAVGNIGATGIVVGGGSGGSVEGDVGGVGMVYESPRSSGEFERSRDEVVLGVLGVPGQDDIVTESVTKESAERATKRPLARGCVRQVRLGTCRARRI